MASLLAPVAYCLLSSVFSLADLLGRQGRSISLLVLGFGSRGRVAGGFPGSVFPKAAINSSSSSESREAVGLSLIHI